MTGDSYLVRVIDEIHCVALSEIEGFIRDNEKAEPLCLVKDDSGKLYVESLCKGPEDEKKFLNAYMVIASLKDEDG